MRKLLLINIRIVMAAMLLLLLLPTGTSAQQAGGLTQPPDQTASPDPQPPAPGAQEAVKRAVKRFGVGVQGGVSLDPELVIIAVHGTFAPIFRSNVEFRPGVELGVGEVTTLVGINLDVLYVLPGATPETRWLPYIGAGPNFSFSHRGFEDTAEDTGNRFDFGEFNFDGGFNFIAGVRNPNGLFLEMKATAYGIPSIRMLAGFNF